MVSPGVVRRRSPFLIAAGISLFWASAAAPKPAIAPPANVRAADALAAQPSGSERDKALQRWAERAPLAELVYVLRRPARELGTAEAVLLQKALERSPAERAALRRRLLSRLAAVDPERHRKLGRGALVTAPLFPRASVFMVAALLPDSGSYQDYGRAVLEGARAGLARPVPPAGLPIEILTLGTGEDQPERALAAFDSLAPRCGSLIGELLSVPTLLLATASRFAAVPLVSPTATDENVGTVSRAVHQIGPSGWERGATLARVALGRERLRIGILASSATESGSFARGFAETARRQGSEVVWRGRYAAGSLNFRDEVRELTTRRCDLLFFDGEAREGEALLRQLTRDRVSVRICGGPSLAPERHHSETRVLLEGVQYVLEDWRLADSLETRPGRAGEANTSFWVRGYLAGRMLAEAVQAGALCPEEVADHLSARTAREPYLKSRGFLDLAAESARLPVWTVRRGRAVAVSESP